MKTIFPVRQDCQPRFSRKKHMQSRYFGNFVRPQAWGLKTLGLSNSLLINHRRQHVYTGATIFVFALPLRLIVVRLGQETSSSCGLCRKGQELPRAPDRSTGMIWVRVRWKVWANLSVLPIIPGMRKTLHMRILPRRFTQRVPTISGEGQYVVKYRRWPGPDPRIAV